VRARLPEAFFPEDKVEDMGSGQRVFMLSGPYCNAGSVIEVAPDGVTVQVDIPGDPRGLHGLRSDMGCLVRFDMTGESLPDYGSEAGPWYLDHVLHGKDAEPWRHVERRRDDPSTW